MKQIQYERINFYTLVRDLIRNIWVIILAAAVGFGGCLTYVTYIHAKQYTSSMTVSINLGGYTTQASAQLVARTIVIAQTIDDVFKSEALADVVVRDLGAENMGTISATQMGDTNFVEITATADTPQKAYNTLKSVAENYPKITDYVFEDVLIGTIENPDMPNQPSNAISPVGMGIIAGGLAALLMVALIVFISYMRDTIKCVYDVEHDLDIKLFGVVYHNRMPKNNGNVKQKMIITNPLVGYQFSESYRRIAVKVESFKRTKGLKVFAITSVAENEGKTTVAINTATALAQNGNRVLLMDCDFKNPSIHYFFNRDEQDNVKDFHKFIDDGGDISEYIHFDATTGLYVADAEHSCKASSEKLSNHRFSEVVSAMKKQFDFIIIDTPPCGLTVDAEIISDSADAVLLVIRQDAVGTDEINDHVESFSKVFVAGCILNNVHTLRKVGSDHTPDDYKYYYHGHMG